MIGIFSKIIDIFDKMIGKKDAHCESTHRDYHFYDRFINLVSANDFYTYLVRKNKLDILNDIYHSHAESESLEEFKQFLFRIRITSLNPNYEFKIHYCHCPLSLVIKR